LVDSTDSTELTDVKELAFDEMFLHLWLVVVLVEVEVFVGAVVVAVSGPL
jgi:hypothetical protein